jgi:hypothetical protein
VPGEQVLDPKVANELVQLMEQVVEKGGTATRASLVGYRVSGKTGTAFKSIAGGYSTDNHGGIRRPGAGEPPETRHRGGNRRAEPGSAGDEHAGRAAPWRRRCLPA